MSFSFLLQELHQKAVEKKKEHKITKLNMLLLCFIAISLFSCF